MNDHFICILTKPFQAVHSYCNRGVTIVSYYITSMIKYILNAIEKLDIYLMTLTQFNSNAIITCII